MHAGPLVLVSSHVTFIQCFLTYICTIYVHTCICVYAHIHIRTYVRTTYVFVSFSIVHALLRSLELYVLIMFFFGRSMIVSMYVCTYVGTSDNEIHSDLFL